MVGKAFQGRDSDSRPCLIVWLIRTGIFGWGKPSLVQSDRVDQTVHVGAMVTLASHELLRPPGQVTSGVAMCTSGARFRSTSFSLTDQDYTFKPNPLRSFRFKSVFNCLLVNGHLCTSVAGPRWPFIGQCRVPSNIGITRIAASSRSIHLGCRHPSPYKLIISCDCALQGRDSDLQASAWQTRTILSNRNPCQIFQVQERVYLSADHWASLHQRRWSQVTFHRTMQGAIEHWHHTNCCVFQVKSP